MNKDALGFYWSLLFDLTCSLFMSLCLDMSSYIGHIPSPLRDKYTMTCLFLVQVPYESLLSALNGDTRIHPTRTPSPPPSTHLQMARIAVANLNLGANKAQVSFGGWRSWFNLGMALPLLRLSD